MFILKMPIKCTMKSGFIKVFRLKIFAVSILKLGHTEVFMNGIRSCFTIFSTDENNPGINVVFAIFMANFETNTELPGVLGTYIERESSHLLFESIQCNT